MSNPDVTPESLRAHSQWALNRQDMATARSMGGWAAVLERESRPLPTVPGWYPNIVVERGGETCTGALLMDYASEWTTPVRVGGLYHHRAEESATTIRWAEQDDTTPGQTLREAEDATALTREEWNAAMNVAAAAQWKDRNQAEINRVLANHGTLTPTDKDRVRYVEGLLDEAHLDLDSARTTAARYLVAYQELCSEQDKANGTPTLTPVGEHPEPGTRGLLPVRVDDANEWNYEDDFTYVCDVNSKMGGTVLADPRPDGGM